MKIKVTSRCESGDMIELPAKDKAAAEKLIAGLQKDVADPASHIQGATLVACLGGKAIINYVGRYSKGLHTVPDEVGKCLVGYGYAEAVSKAS